MIQSPQFRECPGCHAHFPYQDGPADRYGIMSPECWAAFLDILARENEHYGYPPAHRLVVDSHYVQHPPHLEHQQALTIEKRLIDASIQSVAGHLIALYAAIEKKHELTTIAKIMDRVLTNMNNRRLTFDPLEPSTNLGTIRAIDIQKKLLEKDFTLEEYTQLAWQWAYAAWNAWEKHHKIIRYWYEQHQ